jgi:hypothetical protein
MRFVRRAPNNASSPIDLPSDPANAAQDKIHAAEISMLEKQIKIRRDLLGKLSEQTILAVGRERAVLEVQIENEQQAIRDLERSIDNLHAVD